MSWFIFALAGPFLYAITNHVDKILLEKYFKKGGVGTILLFSSLVSIFVLPIILFLEPRVLDVSLANVVALTLVGILSIVLLWCYLLALKDEDASVVILFYQLVPVIGLILGYFILHETLKEMQIIAMSVIILGTAIISFELDEENKLKLKRKTVFLMFTASMSWALSSVLFKVVALEENVLRSMFWEHLVLLMFGVGIFVLIPSYRRHFIDAFYENSYAILSLNALNEFLYIAGNFILAFAYLMAPVSLVLLTNSFQPIFVLLIGYILSVFWPHLPNERLHARHVAQKVTAISITAIGTYLLIINS